MHSSRMRTGRSLTVCCSLLPGGGWVWSWGGCLLGGGVVLPARGDVHRITHTCKNITLATTSLRPVKISIMRIKDVFAYIGVLVSKWYIYEIKFLRYTNEISHGNKINGSQTITDLVNVYI